MTFFRRIRTRIILLFLAAGLLPALFLAALLLDRSFGMLREGIERDNRRVADQVLRLVETRFAGMRRDLERLAADPAVRAFRPAAMRDKMREFFQFVPLFYYYSATSPFRTRLQARLAFRDAIRYGGTR